MSLISGIVKLFANNSNNDKKENKGIVEYPFNNLKNEDSIKINMFGKEKVVRVFCCGDNQFDESGNYKEGAFSFTEKEIEVLKWFVQNIRIEDYAKEILKYCNDIYEDCGDPTITIDDLENEIYISDIAINVTSIPQSKDGYVYPEISFYGGCEAEPEHGICIGFRDKKFIGIEGQDWTL